MTDFKEALERLNIGTSSIPFDKFHEYDHMQFPILKMDILAIRKALEIADRIKEENK